MDSVFTDLPHRRFNPLLGEWLLVSPHRAKRPWQGSVEDLAPEDRPQYDPECYLCPGNERAGGVQNPKYTETFAFQNDFASLMPGEDGAEPAVIDACNGLIHAQVERGICRVICFSPRHDMTLPLMEVEAIGKVVDLWAAQYEELAAVDFISHVQIFENKGAMMGCSNPHPHGQIWANGTVPTLPAKKVATQLEYQKSHGSPMLMDYLEWELAQNERIIAQNDSFVVLVPFWAIWPFELMILPRRAVSSVNELTSDERMDWAAMIKDATTRYDNLFKTSFPYSMGISQKPTDGKDYLGVILHQTFQPPLLRSATVRKFQVGYEMSGEPQRDITPEQAAERLRTDCAGPHYRNI